MRVNPGYLGRIADRLRAVWPSVRPIPDGWEFSVLGAHQADPGARAVVQHGFLCLDVPLAGELDVWRLLSRAALLPGRWKPVRRPSSHDLSLRAEIALTEDSSDEGDDGGDGIVRIERLLQDLPAAIGCVGGPTTGERSDALRAEADPRDEPVDFGALLAEAGWPWVERPGGSVAVDIGAGRGFIQAQVVSQPDGARVRVGLASLESYEEFGRTSVSCLLLRIAGMVRLVRSTISSTDSGPEARLEVFLESDLQAADLNHALSALSVAAELSGAEVGFLRSERAARMYLAARKGVESAFSVHN